MGKATIWTRRGCTTCKQEKVRLQDEGHEVTEYGVEDGEESTMDRDAFSVVHCQNGMFPVVNIDGEFITPLSISQAMEW